MSTYGIIGGTLWGNRGAEAMVATTVGRVRERDPGASFVMLSYYPDKDRELVTDPGVTVVGATPRHAITTWLGALFCRALSVVGVRAPDRLLPAPLRALRGCRALFDVSGISFLDDRIPVVGYNVLCAWPAFLLKVPVVRLAQAMGPFRHPLNRLPARWVTRRSLHTFARGQRTGEFMAQLGAPAGAWSVAPDVAFAYRPEYSLTRENDERVAGVRAKIAALRATGTDVVGLVPSSLVNRKLAATGGDYVGLLHTLLRELRRRGVHVLVLPNATRAGVAAGRNNDITVITALQDRVAGGPSGVDPAAITYVDFDLNTASIRALIEPCKLLITSRFHAMVAALALGVPPVVMGWSHKYAEVLEMFHCEAQAVDFSAAQQEVPAMVGRLLDDHEEAHERIVKALPDVTTRAVAQFDQLDRLP